MGLPGMARPMIAFPRSPLRLPAPTGMDRASLALETKRIGWPRVRPGHEASFDQTGPLRHLRPGLDRARAGPGVQLTGCTIRCCLSLYKESGPCWLYPDPLSLRRWRILRRIDRPSRLAATAGRYPRLED